uniref:hypothetical protein n=1 Tax=Pedobacter nanyangensis TaxID=1562389 RepID=UPI001965A727
IFEKQCSSAFHRSISPAIRYNLLPGSSLPKQSNLKQKYLRCYRVYSTSAYETMIELPAIFVYQPQPRTYGINIRKGTHSLKCSKSVERIKYFKLS